MNDDFQYSFWAISRESFTSKFENNNERKTEITEA